ncbi:MAG TPA: GatB/YqeY domain-containing protein [Patescibacteria group bacterium]|nr:GatB/YqeY domain-containing protein [Patescibacteria group bacterium]
MSLYEKILSDLTAAMKEKQPERVAVLRMVKSALIYTAKTGNKPQTFTDEVVISVLKKEAKKRKESAAAFHMGKREDLAKKEETEYELIQHYLPQELSDDEIRAAIKKIIRTAEKKEFGFVMKQAMQEFKGKADGNRVKTIVEECLSSSSSILNS